MFQVTVSVNPTVVEAMKAENPTVNIYNHNALQSKIYDFTNIYFECKLPPNHEVNPTVDEEKGN